MEAEDLKKIVGKNVRFFRTGRLMSQKELAEALDVKICIIGRYERGESFPSPKMLCKITKFFGISLAKLLEEW